MFDSQFFFFTFIFSGPEAMYCLLEIVAMAPEQLVPQFLDQLSWIKVMFLAHLSTECSVSHCDHSPSVVVRPSVHNLLVNTLASTNINQSSPNLVKMYMTTRARMSSIMVLIRPELSKLSALELENLPYLTMFTL